MEQQHFTMEGGQRDVPVSTEPISTSYPDSLVDPPGRHFMRSPSPPLRELASSSSQLVTAEHPYSEVATSLQAVSCPMNYAATTHSSASISAGILHQQHNLPTSISQAHDSYRNSHLFAPPSVSSSLGPGKTSPYHSPYQKKHQQLEDHAALLDAFDNFKESLATYHHQQQSHSVGGLETSVPSGYDPQSHKISPIEYQGLKLRMTQDDQILHQAKQLNRLPPPPVAIGNIQTSTANSSAERVMTVVENFDSARYNTQLFIQPLMQDIYPSYPFDNKRLEVWQPAVGQIAPRARTPAVKKRAPKVGRVPTCEELPAVTLSSHKVHIDPISNKPSSTINSAHQKLTSIFNKPLPATGSILEKSGSLVSQTSSTTQSARRKHAATNGAPLSKLIKSPFSDEMISVSVDYLDPSGTGKVAKVEGTLGGKNKSDAPIVNAPASASSAQLDNLNTISEGQATVAEEITTVPAKARLTEAKDTTTEVITSEDDYFLQDQEYHNHAKIENSLSETEHEPSPASKKKSQTPRKKSQTQKKIETPRKTSQTPRNKRKPAGAEDEGESVAKVEAKKRDRGRPKKETK